MKKLLIGLFFFISSSSFLGANAPNPGSSMIYPVLAVDMSNASNELKVKLVEMFSTSFDKSIKTILSENYYGSGKKFKYSVDGGYFSRVTSFQKAFFSELDNYQKTNQEFKTLVGNSTYNFQVDLYWTLDPSKIEPSINAPVIFDTFMKLIDTTESNTQLVVDFMNSVGNEGIRYLDTSNFQNSKKIAAIRMELGKVYKVIDSNFGPMKIPLSMGFDLRIYGSDYLSLKTSLDIIPSRIVKTDFEKDPESSTRIMAFIMQPTNVIPGRQIALRSNFFQQSGSKAATELTIEFDWFRNTFNDTFDAFQIETSGRVKGFNSIPTIWVKLQSKLLDGWGFDVDFISGGFNDIEIYIKKIVLDFNTNKIIREKSILPVAIKNFNGKAGVVLNTKGSGGGFDLLNKIKYKVDKGVGNTVSDNLELRIQSEIKNADDKFTEMMAPISQYL